MSNWKTVVLSAIALTLIAGAVTAALAGTNALTESTIAAQEAEAINTARREVIDADAFEEVALSPADGDQVSCVRATKEGQPVGYIFTVTTRGKSSGLVIMTGIRTDGTISGVAVTKEQETAGYVAAVEKAGLLDSFCEKPAQPFTIGQNVDKVSNATKTSKGVIDGVNTAVRYFERITKEAGL